MNALAARNCIPCRKGADPLEPEAARKLAREIPDWSLQDNATRIERNYPFKNFAQAFAFVGKVAAIAEAADHHPDIGFGWGYARLSLQTHSIGGLHENDFIIAARCDDAFRD